MVHFSCGPVCYCRWTSKASCSTVSLAGAASQAAWKQSSLVGIPSAHCPGIQHHRCRHPPQRSSLFDTMDCKTSYRLGGSLCIRSVSSAAWPWSLPSNHISWPPFWCSGAKYFPRSHAAKRSCWHDRRRQSISSRCCSARDAPIAVSTFFTSSGGGSTAGMPSDSIHNSRDHPLVW